MPAPTEGTGTAGGGDLAAPAVAATSAAVQFGALADPVVLHEAGDILPAFDRVQSGWTRAIRPLEAPRDAVAPVAALAGGPDGYTIHSRYLEAPLAGLTTTSAVCCLIADLAHSGVETNPDGLTLHCGAVRRGGRLVVLTGAARAGKSTLVARLAAETDGEVVCDDVLPLSPEGEATALGFFPRLRLPLPANAAPGFRDFVARRLTLADERYGYVAPERQVPLGPAGPVGAIVMLDRRLSGPARLEPVPGGEAARYLLQRNMNHRLGLECALRQIELVTRSAVLCRLSYADLEDAVAVLRRTFPAGGDWPAVPLAPATTGPGDAAARDSAGMAAAPAPMDAVFMQAPNVIVRPLGGTLFLSHPAEQEAVDLNPAGAAVWRYLAEPACGQEIAEALSEAFPEEEPERIARDVAAILGALVAAGLLAPAEAAGP